MTGKFHFGPIIKYLTVGIIVCLGELILQHRRLNGFLLIGTLLPLYAVNMQRQTRWWLIVPGYGFCLYVLFQYPLWVAATIALATTAAVFIAHKTTHMIPHGLRFWIVVVIAVLAYNTGAYMAMLLGVIPFYSAVLGLLVAMVSTAIAVLFRPLSDLS